MTTRNVDVHVVRDWAGECARSLYRLRGEIDDINVYPVADSDTGSNLLATVVGGNDALTTESSGEQTRLSEDGVGGVLAVFAGGAVRAARGNSGVILAQALRGLADAASGLPELDGDTFVRALDNAATVATAAVANPVEGTMLSVLRAAADGAREAGSTRIGVVVTGAAAAAARAVAATPGQLRTLAQAGVVDAGGRGVVAVLDALVTALTGTGRDPLPDHAPGAWGAADRVRGYHRGTPEWEVMYLLDGLSAVSVRNLRERLTALGDSVSIAEDGTGTHVVHVHCDDIGSALEEGIGFGTPRRVSVEPLSCTAAVAQQSRGLVVVVRGDPLVDLVAAEGVNVLRVAADEVPDASELLALVAAAGTQHVTILTGEPDLTATAEEVTARDDLGELDTVVVPCRTPVQMLAALAVHDPGRRTSDDVVGMAEAAAATRRGELRIAAEQSLSWLGTAEAGSLVGFVDGEVVSIEQQPDTSADVTAAVVRMVQRMLVLGGELVTVLTGEQAPDTLADELTGWAGAAHPEVELVCYSGGQRACVVLIGVE